MPRKKKVVRKQREAPLLTYNERERLQREIKADQEYLDSFERTPRGSNSDTHLSPGEARGVDTSAVRARMGRNRKALEKMSPVNRRFTKVAQKNSAHKEMKEHEEWFRKHMLSTYDQGAFPSTEDPGKQQRYLAACKKSEAQEAGSGKKAVEFRERAERYKELARKLDPDNPEMANIERFRSTKRY